MASRRAQPPTEEEGASRYEFFQFLWDTSSRFHIRGVGADPDAAAQLRAKLRRLLRTRPLDAFFVARRVLLRPDPPLMTGFFARVPVFVILGHLLPFLDQQTLYTRFFNVCRWTSRLPLDARVLTGEGIRGESYGGRVICVPDVIDHKSIYHLYWKSRKLLSMRGFYAMDTKSLQRHTHRLASDPSDQLVVDSSSSSIVISTRPLFSNIDVSKYFPVTVPVASDLLPCAGDHCAAEVRGQACTCAASSNVRLILALREEAAILQRHLEWEGGQIALPALKSLRLVDSPLPQRRMNLSEWMHAVRCPNLCEAVLTGCSVPGVEKFLSAHQETLRAFLCDVPDGSLDAFKSRFGDWCGVAHACEIVSADPRLYDGFRYWDRVECHVTGWPASASFAAKPALSQQCDALEAVSICAYGTLIGCGPSPYKLVSINPRVWTDPNSLFRSAKAVALSNTASVGLGLLQRAMDSAELSDDLTFLQELEVSQCGPADGRICPKCRTPNPITRCRMTDVIVIDGPVCEVCLDLLTTLDYEVEAGSECEGPRCKWRRRGSEAPTGDELKVAAVFPMLFQAPDIFNSSGCLGSCVRLFAWNEGRGYQADCPHHAAVRRMINAKPIPTSSSIWFVKGCRCSFEWVCRLVGQVTEGTRYLAKGDRVDALSRVWEFGDCTSGAMCERVAEWMRCAVGLRRF